MYAPRHKHKLAASVVLWAELTSSANRFGRTGCAWQMAELREKVLAELGRTQGWQSTSP